MHILSFRERNSLEYSTDLSFNRNGLKRLDHSIAREHIRHRRAMNCRHADRRWRPLWRLFLRACARDNCKTAQNDRAVSEAHGLITFGRLFFSVSAEKVNGV